MEHPRIFIGTSGWTYADWAGRFYPDKVKGTERLSFYAQRFNTVEVNATFYRNPTKAMLDSWNKRLGPEFHLVVKGSRLITHMKKLKDCREPLKNFLDLALQLQRLKVILWQLPPSLQKDLNRLDYFLSGLPRTICHAVEFRHESWWDEETVEILSRHEAAFVSVSHQSLPDTIHATADFLYLRFHGAGKQTYRYDYSRAELSEWAFRVKPYLKGRTLYAFFNNDYHAHAPRNAAVLRELLSPA